MKHFFIHHHHMCWGIWIRIVEKVFTYLVTAALKNAESEMISDLARCIVEDMIVSYGSIQ